MATQTLSDIMFPTKKSCFILLIAIFAPLMVSASSVGDTLTISHQGYLTNDSGAPVEDGAYDVTFKIFDQATEGESLWSETQNLEVRGGVYTVQLGSENPLDLSFDTRYWLEITINEENTLTPRIPLGAVPYAFTALSVKNGAISGKSLSDDIDIETNGTIQADSVKGHGGGLVGVKADSIKPGSVGSQQLKGGAVDSTILANGAVDSSKLANGAVNSGKLANGAVNSQNMANGAVNSGNLANDINIQTSGTIEADSVKGHGGGLTGVKADSLAQNSVGSGELKGGAVQSGNISSGAVQSGNIASGSVDSTKVASGGVGSGNLASGAVNSDKMANGAVNSGNLANDINIQTSGTIEADSVKGHGGGLTGVKADSLGQNSVGSEQLKGGAVQSGNIASGAVDSTKVASEGVGSSNLASGAVQSGNISSGAVQSGNIASGAVDSTKVASGGVGSGNLASGAVQSGNIASGAVDSTKVASGGVGSGNLASGAVQSGNISSGAVQSGNIASGAVDSTKVASGGVGSGNLASGAVNSDKMANGAVNSGNLASDIDIQTSGTIQGRSIQADTIGGGHVSGDLNVDGMVSKKGGNFEIDHPLDPDNKILRHSFMESPEMKNMYDGVITTNDNGKAVVKLPSYFEALNKDFKYQLTVIGEFAQAIIDEEIENNEFVIRTDEPNVKVSWQVTGVRNDAWAKENRIEVVEEK